MTWTPAPTTPRTTSVLWRMASGAISAHLTRWRPSATGPAPGRLDEAARLGVDGHPGHRGVEAVETGGEQGAAATAEHVTGPPGRQGHGAVLVDVKAAVRGGDHRLRTLQDQDDAALGSEAASQIDPIGLHLGGGDAGEPRHLRGV